jgi:hypothetical protein
MMQPPGADDVQRCRQQERETGAQQFSGTGPGGFHADSMSVHGRDKTERQQSGEGKRLHVGQALSRNTGTM